MTTPLTWLSDRLGEATPPPPVTRPACGHTDCHLVKHPRIAVGVAIRECRIDAHGLVVKP